MLPIVQMGILVFRCGPLELHQKKQRGCDAAPLFLAAPSAIIGGLIPGIVTKKSMYNSGSNIDGVPDWIIIRIITVCACSMLSENLQSCPDANAVQLLGDARTLSEELCRDQTSTSKQAFACMCVCL